MIVIRKFLLLLILKLVNGRRLSRNSDGKKSVRFRENLESTQASASSDYYFSFGDNSSKKHKSSRSSSTASARGNKKPLFTTDKGKLKSALKKPTAPMEDQIIYQSSLHNSNGAFDISKSTENSNVNKNLFNGEASSINGQLENANIFSVSRDDFNNDGAFIPPNPYRNVGPTPQIIYDLSPERFWLPPNAPITQNIPGPFLPLSLGVPGGVPVTNGLPITDFYSPGVPDYTGPRDIDNIQVDPLIPSDIARQTGVGTIGSYRPPYEVPRILPPLNNVTPIPGGNIIDPLSPQVNNIRGPFFPDRPFNDGAFLFEADQPQFIARDIEEGPYIVERVTDPIVFFDPVIGQTVLFDPVRNFTRRYNPETDPELPIDSIEDSEIGPAGTVGTSNGLQQVQTEARSSQSRMNGGGFLKSMSNTKNGGEIPKNPAFWILKKLDSSDLEKSGGTNGKQSNGKVIFQTPNSKSLQITQQEIQKKPKKKQIISHYKAPKLSQSPQNYQITADEQFQIQLGTKEEEKKVTKTDSTEKETYKVTLVYQPIVDIELKKRYNGFKAQGNDASSQNNPSIKITLAVLLLLFTIFMV